MSQRTLGVRREKRRQVSGHQSPTFEVTLVGLPTAALWKPLGAACQAATYPGPSFMKTCDPLGQ